MASDWETVEVVGSGLLFLLNRQQIERLCAGFEYKSAPFTALFIFVGLSELCVDELNYSTCLT